MGSFFAGVKAGTVAGVAYLGVFALFNVGVLYATKAESLSVLSSSLQQYCTTSGAVNGTITGTAQECFDSVVTVLVPFAAVLAFFVSLIYAGIFGRLYERFPGKGASSRGATLGVVVGVNLLIIGLTGIYFATAAKVAVTSFFVIATLLYGVFVGRLYKRYTREVQFVSQEGSGLKIIVGRQDYTGKKMTFAVKSTHDLKARVSEGSQFRGWSVSGGVSVEDPNSIETTMDVEGDGMLIAQSSRQS